MGALNDLDTLDVTSNSLEDLAKLRLGRVGRKVSAENGASVSVISLHKGPAGRRFSRCLHVTADLRVNGLAVISVDLATRAGLSGSVVLLAPRKSELVKRLCDKPRADGL